MTGAVCIIVYANAPDIGHDLECNTQTVNFYVCTYMRYRRRCFFNCSVMFLTLATAIDDVHALGKGDEEMPWAKAC